MIHRADYSHDTTDSSSCSSSGEEVLPRDTQHQRQTRNSNLRSRSKTQISGSKHSLAMNSQSSTSRNTHDQPQHKQQSPLVLLVCASGICGCYLYFGIVQERVFSKGNSSLSMQEVGSITTFMLVLSCIVNVLVSTLWIWIQNKIFSNSFLTRSDKKEDDRIDVGSIDKRPLNHSLLLANAFTYFAAMAASNEALMYVSYPTAVLAKSSKLIPNMVSGLILEKKSFSVEEWCSAAFITGGIIIFNLSKMSDAEQGAGDDSSYGIFLLAFSLAMDGLLASCQGFLKRASKESKYREPIALESMLFVNAYACLFMLPLSIMSGQFANGVKLFNGSVVQEEGEVSIPWTIGLLNITAAAGQIFIFFTIQLFSPLMCTTITTTRKFFTILLSVWKFDHHFTYMQWVAILMVFGGLYLAIVSKFANTKKKMIKTN